MSKNLGIGIDLGGTLIKAAAIDLVSGALLHKDTRATRDGEESVDGPPAWAAAVRDLVDVLEAQLPQSASVIGISAPGLADRESTRIRFMPGRLQGLENLVWSEFLGRDSVPVLNDAHAALMGEIWQGAARGMQDVVLLTLGTGVGGAIVSDGRLLRGHLGRAGHLGHVTVDFEGPPDICNTPGSLEDAIGNCTAGERFGGMFENTHALIEACQDGHAVATAIWRRSVRALAAAIASIVNTVDPECVLLGGGIAEAGDVLFNPLNDFLEKFEWRPGGHKVKILPAQLGEWAGTHGAAFFALQQKEGDAHFGRMKDEG